MSEESWSGRVAGVDGCPGGWVAVLREGAGAERIRRIESLEALLDWEDAPEVIAVDIPIGLPDRSGAAGRTPERLVRPLLGARQSSVFSIPARAAVYAPDYGEACRLALAGSDPPRQVSKQGFMLFPKIRAVDRLLQDRPDLRERMFECHPEVSFSLMNRGPLAEPKKVKGRPWPAGLAERKRLLAAAGFTAYALEATPPAGAALDDLLDACACCWTAGRILAGMAESFPDPPERDTLGIPVAIWA